MNNNILIGESDFKNIRKANLYYVDKSLFVEEFIKCPYQSILIPRPRRFGKTINISLLHHFFEKKNQDESNLFDGLAIKQSDVFKEHYSKYPVIFMTFKDIKHINWNNCLEDIKLNISQLFENHKYLLNSDSLSAHQSHIFKDIIEMKASYIIYCNALNLLSKFLNRYHNQSVIILIDEYDTPIHAGYQHEYDNEVVSFMRNFLSGGLKDNSDLFKAAITGTLRISKESIFTGLNNLGVFTLFEAEFNKCFGFTIDEIKIILNDFALSHYYDEILKWYDGYNFGDITILNPWSVMNFIASHKKVFKPYWLNTSSMEMIEEVVTPEKKLLREELNDLIEGKSITKIIHENIVFNDIKDSKSDLIWSFLLHSGYLKVVKEVQSNLRRKFELKIPNLELRIIYIELIEKWIKNHIDLRKLECLLSSLQKGDVTVFEKHLKIICMEIMSYHDFSGSPEKVYHALVLGMLVWLSNDYDIRSNRESGYGRYDIIFQPKDNNRQGIIIEFKLINDDEKAESVLDNALKQINEKKYDVELKAAGIKNVLKIAIGFTGKDVYLKKWVEYT